MVFVLVMFLLVVGLVVVASVLGLRVVYVVLRVLCSVLSRFDIRVFRGGSREGLSLIHI